MTRIDRIVKLLKKQLISLLKPSGKRYSIATQADLAVERAPMVVSLSVLQRRVPLHLVAEAYTVLSSFGSPAKVEGI